MGQVLSFTSARAGRVKAKLRDIAEMRGVAIVETPSRVLDAQRIFCRETFAVLIDRYGVQTRLDYAEITEVSLVLPVSEIIRIADWQVIAADEEPAAAMILAFPPCTSG